MLGTLLAHSLVRKARQSLTFRSALPFTLSSNTFSWTVYWVGCEMHTIIAASMIGTSKLNLPLRKVIAFARPLLPNVYGLGVVLEDAAGGRLFDSCLLRSTQAEQTHRPLYHHCNLAVRERLGDGMEDGWSRGRYPRQTSASEGGKEGKADPGSCHLWRLDTERMCRRYRRLEQMATTNISMQTMGRATHCGHLIALNILGHRNDPSPGHPPCIVFMSPFRRNPAGVP